MTIPECDDVNVLIKEKRLKYKDLQIEISRMWNVKTKVVAVVIFCFFFLCNK